MGIKLGDISPMAGAISGKGLFGKGLGAMNRALGPMAGIMPRLAGSAQKKTARRAAAAAEAEAMRKADFDAKRGAAAGMRGRPMMEEFMVAEEAPAGAPMMRKGGKVKKKPMATKKMAKGGSTASKRADGCATKGKTKGRFV
jgi:hypothetical protein